jgi:hypothetical protein
MLQKMCVGCAKISHLQVGCDCPCHTAKPISVELATAIAEARKLIALVNEMHKDDKRLAELYREFKYPDPFEATDAQAFLEASRKAQQVAKEYLGSDRYGRFLSAKEAMGQKIDAIRKLFLKEFDVEYPKLD